MPRKRCIELFPKVAVLVEIPGTSDKYRKKIMEGDAPALRFIRAGTRLTVHRALPLFLFEWA